jgi:SAM-dependent methyltransferase
VKTVERFTTTSSAYARWRPDYPAGFVRWIAQLASGRRCVDLGSGTGILSRQLADAGFSVTGVEPNEAMRAAAAEAGGGPSYVDGRAEETGLPDGSADLVTAAQAFHWFDVDRTLAEIGRVLADTGIACAVWNLRELQGFAAAYDAVIDRFSTEYRDVPRPDPTMARLRSELSGEAERAWPHHQLLDLDGVVGRAWSSSYVAHGVKDRAAFDAAMTDAFHRHAIAGKVTLHYRTVAIAWPKQRAAQ